LTAAGHDTLHTLDLPLGNQTSDEDLAALAAQDQRILVTKDSDFVASFHLKRSPPKLLLVSTGNVDNETLLYLFLANIVHLERAFTKNDFVELNRTALTLHG
jgi:predicted nuclease of predicted toxin-antitoxin system